MLDQIVTTHWHIVETMDSYRSYGKNAKPQIFLPGEKGYARRNEYSPDMIQVLMRDTDDSISGWYISEEKAAELLIPLKKFNNTAHPDMLWNGYWWARFRD